MELLKRHLVSVSGKQILSKYGGNDVVQLWEGLRDGLELYYGGTVAKEVNKGSLRLIEIFYRIFKREKDISCDKLSSLFFDVVNVYECCCERLSSTRCSGGQLAEDEVVSCTEKQKVLWTTKLVRTKELLRQESIYTCTKCFDLKKKQNDFVEKVFDFLQSKQFWADFFCEERDAEYKTPRKKCLVALQNIVIKRQNKKYTEQGNVRPKSDSVGFSGGKRCRKPGCRFTAYSGQYCDKHSVENYERMIRDPELYKFLSDPIHRAHLQSWFLRRNDNVNVNRMLLWYAIDNFKACSSPSLRERRSCKIYHRYLKPGVSKMVRVHERVETLVEECFSSKGFVLSEILFQVQGAVYISLERIFLGEYVTSSDFRKVTEGQEEILNTPREEKMYEWRLPGDQVDSRSTKKRLELDNQKIHQGPTEALFTPLGDLGVYSTARERHPDNENSRTNRVKAYTMASLRPLVPKLNIIPRSADGRDSGLLVTPRSSRIEETDSASAALIGASFGQASRGRKTS